MISFYNYGTSIVCIQTTYKGWFYKHNVLLFISDENITQTLASQNHQLESWYK